MSNQDLKFDLLSDLRARLHRTLPRGDLIATALPECPAIQLYLYDPNKLQGPLSHEEAQAAVECPAYWSFCWASGQVLALYIFEHPETVRGKVVVDFGCGSAVVAIAAKMAGAKKVIACDMDADAIVAAKANAALNSVELEYESDWFNLAGHYDLVVAADVLYDRDNLIFLDHFTAKSEKVLLGDSRVKNLADTRYKVVGSEVCRTWPDLNEFEEFNTVRIYLSDGL
ncbi:MAG: methyltransferase [Hahellaceae bacterium]|nr:methyltransferase [Hahellaceae bacterium]MCP5210729.1 methyltransferase [Hahellaceae bacterium]